MYFLLLIAAHVVPAQAQDDDSFFGKDFARQPGRDRPVVAATAKPQTRATPVFSLPTPSSADDALKQQVRDIATKARAAENTVLTPAANRTVHSSGKQTIEIVEVGAVLDGTNKDLIERQLADMIEVVDGKKRLFNHVYVLGGAKDISDKLAYEVAMRGGTIRYIDLDDLPEKYRVIKQAPAWILAGPNQEILIEGSGNLSENLSPEGAIITRATEKVSPAATGSSRPAPRQP